MFKLIKCLFFVLFIYVYSYNLFLWLCDCGTRKHINFHIKSSIIKINNRNQSSDIQLKILFAEIKRTGQVLTLSRSNLLRHYDETFPLSRYTNITSNKTNIFSIGVWLNCLHDNIEFYGNHNNFLEAMRRYNVIQYAV